MAYKPFKQYVFHFWVQNFSTTTTQSKFCDTVEPGDSKPLDSKLLALVNFFPLTNLFIT